MALKLEKLRKKYPKFIYQGYSFKDSGGNLEIFFDFKIEPNIFFKPKIVFKNIEKKQIKRVGERFLESLIFHLGLIEIPSYWKATCSPLIEIRAGFLNRQQIDWWKEVIIKGMGQFFYENKINFLTPNFFDFKVSFKRRIFKRDFSLKLKNRSLVPIGGGKDSIVTLEKLKEKKEEIVCFFVNPTKTMEKVVRIAKIRNVVEVKREIHPKLLELNKRGFLNGHTPITAVISFLSILGAILFNCKNIIFSNEKSADEGNLNYLGKTVNHQWSKSSEFERKFQWYCKNYLAREINYFSFLRKYSELEIAKMFVKYPRYFFAFSGCNVVKAKRLRKKWCGKCPKCLFTFLILYPFLGKGKLIKIFKKNLFNDRDLIPLMKALIDSKEPKPFECVGTKKESLEALKLTIKRAKKEFKRLPILLKNFQHLLSKK